MDLLKTCVFLAITKGQSISIFSTYIVFLTEMQKRQTPEKGSALFKKTISQIFQVADIFTSIGGIGIGVSAAAKSHRLKKHS